MIKYPLYVTLDTNIFISNKFDFGQDSTLGILAEYVKSGKIKVVLSNIVIKEVERHIIDKGNSICASIKKLRKEVLKNTSKEYIKQIGLDGQLLIPDKEVIEAKSAAEWKRYIDIINPEIIDNSFINIDKIIEDYFDCNPPFEKDGKKKSEFPDAFIVNQITNKFRNDTIAIVSDDNGVIQACEKSGKHLQFSSLGELFNYMTREEEEYGGAVKIVNSFIPQYIEQIKKTINDDCIEVHGLLYDKDGLWVGGYDYDETFVSSVNNTLCMIRTIDEISETTVKATLLCRSNIEVECYYDDYDNAIWDSETKSYIFLETKKIIEKHAAVFACRVEVEKDSSDFKIFPFTVILNHDTLKEQIEMDENENEHYFMDLDRTELGFCSLDGYGEYLDDNLLESSFNLSVISLFEEINDLYREYEEITTIYENLIEVIRNDKSKETIKFLSKKFKENTDFPYPDDLSKISDEEVNEVLNWAERECDRLYELCEKEHLPDALRYGETINIFENGSLYQLELNEFSGQLHEGDEETINIYIKDKIGNIVASGHVQLTVGFIEFDENGCAGDGLQDSIWYWCDSVIEKIEQIKRNIKIKLQEEQAIAEIIKYSIDIENDLDDSELKSVSIQ